MKFEGPLLVVTDLEKSKQFYKEVLGLHVVMDFGANITLTGGLSLQTKETWKDFISVSDEELVFGGKTNEVYFEEDDFEQFQARLEEVEHIEYVHPVKEHSWGQRVVRIYDPDRHIIEIGENIKVVCVRFLESGMTEEETARRMEVPVKFVNACKRWKQGKSEK